MAGRAAWQGRMAGEHRAAQVDFAVAPPQQGIDFPQRPDGVKRTGIVD